MARSVKQTVEAPSGSRKGRRASIRAPHGTAEVPDADPTSASNGNGTTTTSWPIYEELVAELGDPTA